MKELIEKAHANAVKHGFHDRRTLQKQGEMRTLELKDICGYLPYGLKVYHNQCIGTDTLFEVWYHPIKDDERVVCGINSRLKLDEITPILHPMSDLAKEITHKGETFVPIDVLRRIYRFIEFDYAGLLYFSKGGLDSDWLAIFDKLSEWMFDYRGLIDEGLAIDVNMLPNNPY